MTREAVVRRATATFYGTSAVEEDAGRISSEAIRRSNRRRVTTFSNEPPSLHVQPSGRYCVTEAKRAPGCSDTDSILHFLSGLNSYSTEDKSFEVFTSPEKGSWDFSSLPHLSTWTRR